MNKDTLTGLILMGVLLVAYTWWTQPSQEEIETYKRQQDSIAAVQRDVEVKAQMAEADRKAKAEVAARGDSTALFFQASITSRSLTFILTFCFCFILSRVTASSCSCVLVFLICSLIVTPTFFFFFSISV